jgi:phosphoribosylformylglycinamidine synthase
LNFGNPERAEVMADFAAAVRGIGDACRAFGIPVTGGNVSFYNESPLGAVHPTPVVGMLGVLEDVYAYRPVTAKPGDVVVLLGEAMRELGGSEALAVVHDTIAGRAPSLDLAAEVAVTRLLAIPGLGSHAHDLSEGGLGVALAELCVRSGAGLVVTAEIDPLWGLFGESTARALLTCDGVDVDRILSEAQRLGVPARVIGLVDGAHLDVAGALNVPVSDLARAYEETIPSLMDR